jgi:hypothetical protein
MKKIIAVSEAIAYANGGQPASIRSMTLFDSNVFARMYESEKVRQQRQEILAFIRHLFFPRGARHMAKIVSITSPFLSGVPNRSPGNEPMGGASHFDLVNSGLQPIDSRLQLA